MQHYKNFPYIYHINIIIYWDFIINITQSKKNYIYFSIFLSDNITTNTQINAKNTLR